MTSSNASALWQLPAVELADLFERRAASPMEVLEVFLDRCARLNPLLNAIVALDESGARASAHAAERRMLDGSRLGLLDGVPVTVKDNIFVKGLKATWGSSLYRDFYPGQDDIAVDRLRAAGAVILGKTNTPEFALAAYTDNPVFGATKNPWNPTLTPGGSSGGAVASLAAGMSPLALGTDAAGSIRRPAGYTGVVGFRPTTGRIARYHGFPPLAGDFQVIAPAARTVADTEALYRTVAGPDMRDRASNGCAVARGAGPSSPSRLRVRCVLRIDDAPIDRQIVAAVRSAADLLLELGHFVEEGAAPYALEEIERTWLTLSASGLARVVSKYPDWNEKISPAAAAICERGRRLTAIEYVEALDTIAKLRAGFVDAFDAFDILLTPTSAAQPWSVETQYPTQIDGRDAGPRAAAVFATFVNAAGLPAISIPAGRDSAGLPVGMQLVGSYGADDLVIGLAAQLETARPWSMSWPPLALEEA